MNLQSKVLVKRNCRSAQNTLFRTEENPDSNLSLKEEESWMRLVSQYHAM